MLNRIAPLCMLAWVLSAAACGSSPSAPSSATAGAWTGTFSQTTCDLTAPPGQLIDTRTCAHNRVGDALVTLTAAGSGQTLDVTLTSAESGSDIVTSRATVTGSGAIAAEQVRQNSAGSVTTVTISGERPAVFRPFQLRVEVFTAISRPEGAYTDRRAYAVALTRASR